MLTSFSDPLETLLAFQRALDARRESEWMGRGTAGVGGYPPINIFEKGDDFVAIIELPGIEKNDLAIEAKDKTIRISGKKKAAYDEKASLHRRERLSGTFDRTISLPLSINTEAITADYQNGVLTLSIPRAESEKPRTIKIN
jgi:HSP20 family protein